MAATRKFEIFGETFKTTANRRYAVIVKFDFEKRDSICTPNHDVALNRYDYTYTYSDPYTVTITKTYKRSDSLATATKSYLEATPSHWTKLHGKAIVDTMTGEVIKIEELGEQ